MLWEPRFTLVINMKRMKEKLQDVAEEMHLRKYLFKIPVQQIKMGTDQRKYKFTILFINNTLVIIILVAK